MNPGDVVPLSFNSGLVALSFLTAVLGSYVALLAAASIRTETEDGDIRLGYIIIGAVAMGGVGIWSMHFIGMQAQNLPFDVGYQVGLTALSFIVAAGFSGWAFWYVGRERFTFGRCLIGGMAAGLGVAAMHYLGMGAMRMPAVLLWNLPIVVLSVLIAVIAASAALWLAFNTQNEFQRGGAAILMAIAVCGMHYTGAGAGTVICSTPREATSLQIGGVMLPYIAFVLSAVMLLIMRWQLQRASTRFRTRMAQRIDSFIESAPVAEPGKTPGSTLGPG
ncbi:MHYT domain-containing protein [Achromobacter piechaudii]|uniref:Bacterial signaling N terminal domain repeat protein n=1 Tax=Achromobacter piechaudii ATCC 43553 TaxID=742159 RepID=D4XG54_9BURK|nr:MHYT domain-containing protein [Achromobacter piechaudii]EFF74243.1 bacterial signaling N terminal domain repeat protein [Achromobacter piechaudii ATCC 43553]